ncbi:unnamed protein product [Clavelina lepadiformis]|uniref:Uncharacterized protein n=1 Tax=Clavelina lepadiformis TaxID=159417 RepID=A0ABP0GK71_CLALP
MNCDVYIIKLTIYILYLYHKVDDFAWRPARHVKSSGPKHINKLSQDYGLPFLIEFQTAVLALFEKIVVLLRHKLVLLRHKSPQCVQQACLNVPSDASQTRQKNKAGTRFQRNVYLSN